MGNYGTSIDKKWQDKWENEHLYKFDPTNLDKKLYVLLPIRKPITRWPLV